MRRIALVLCAATCLSGGVPAESHAQEGTFGVGGFASLTLPLFNFRDMYGNGTTFGGTIHYNLGKRKIAEVEYHYARFTDGSLETRTFTFSDGVDYASPNASADMTFHSFTANWLFAPKTEGFSRGSAPYFALGVGLRDYASKVSGLIFPGQIPASADAPPDPSIVMEPINDTRTSFSASLGGGVMIPVGGRAAIDIRARYNLVMGELRPFLVWGVEKTFPFNLVDIGVGLKVNLE